MAKKNVLVNVTKKPESVSKKKTDSGLRKFY